MNQENLKHIFQNYKNKMPVFNNPPHDEWFKWQAVQQFQQVWATNLPFPEKIKQATSKCEVLLDNGHVTPLSGILKVAECEPAEMERLFTQVLFADDGGDLEVRQNNIDAFLEGVECVRHQHFPQSWKFRQDRHIASPPTTTIFTSTPSLRTLLSTRSSGSISVLGNHFSWRPITKCATYW